MNAHFSRQRLTDMLAAAGMLPFLLLMLACWVADTDWLGVFLRAQLAWGIAILSFLGGIHWGAVLSRQDLDAQHTRAALVQGILPTALAWSSTLAGGFGFALLMAGYVIAYQADKRHFSRYGIPDHFLILRRRLTAAVVFTLALTVIAANVRG